MQLVSKQARKRLDRKATKVSSRLEKMIAAGSRGRERKEEKEATSRYTLGIACGTLLILIWMVIVRR